MTYKNNQLCQIRTITAFICLDSKQQEWEAEILKATRLCTKLSSTLTNNEYTVQSLRIVTNPFGEYLNTETLKTAKEGLKLISHILASIEMPSIRIRFAIGEAKTRKEIGLLPELIKEFGDLCNVCVNIDMQKSGILDNQFIQNSAEVIQKISKITPNGEGNFNFTVNFNCPPLIPYFPASYHDKKLGNCFVIGLETPDLLLAALKQQNNGNETENHHDRYYSYYQAMLHALQFHVDQIKNIIEKENFDNQFTFSGFDSSAAPSKNCSSMTDIYEEMGVEYFGASGTVEASSLLTKVFKSIQNTQLVGFSGLMLALTEDTGLAKGTENFNFDIRSLLTYSAVCGIGLDTVPIPGNTPIEKITAIMRDTGTMAFRLNKPLTVRLFPAPGLNAGEMTRFTSEDLCNCLVLDIP